MVKQCTPHSGRSGPVVLALFSVLFPLLSQPIRMVNDNYIIRVIRVNVFWRHPANHVIRVIRVNVFLPPPDNRVIRVNVFFDDTPKPYNPCNLKFI